MEDKRSKLGVALQADEAATRIQSVMRGFLWRKMVHKEVDNELMFIGMRPRVSFVAALGSELGQAEK
jgi:hypothetical protein